MSSSSCLADFEQVLHPGYHIRECNCCPYGYHIDLDFVRYCESVCQETERTGSLKKRKDRRRQRHSMDVLLGLTQPSWTTYDFNYKVSDEQASHNKQHEDLTKKKFMFILQNDFASALLDFEGILKPIQNKLTCSSPNIAESRKDAPITSVAHLNAQVLTADGIPGKDYDSSNIDSSGLSPLALQKIRQQMALSLERTKHLENEVKIIPGLKEQLSLLKEENVQLQTRLLNRVSKASKSVDSLYDEYLFSLLDETTKKLSNTNNKKVSSPPPRKDFGVMCGVRTRNVGVGNQTPNTKNVSTTTFNNDFEFADKWYYEKLKLMNTQPNNSSFELKKSQNLASRSTQTIATNEKRGIGVQTSLEFIHRRTTADMISQTDSSKFVIDKGINVSPVYSDCAVQKNIDNVTIGVSIDTINSILCDKCNVTKISVGVGPELLEDSHTSQISLASLNFPRSKSFNLGDDRLSFSKKHRSVACQYESSSSSKSCQAEIRASSKASPCFENNSKPENDQIFKSTDVKGYNIISKNVGCEIKYKAAKNCDMGSNTPTVEKEPTTNKERDSPTPSRIPRPQMPTTPIEERKFRRQDTFTVDKALPTSTKGLEPSSEMRGAMKVLNDALCKSQTKNVFNHTAINIIREEWFKISSLATANPLHIENYLDAFEEVSLALLECIVNITDNSGNTAMHYAVSHGNFDVVSILLDSKVCDINKSNKAGYTSVMLVSLAQLQSQAHTCVIRRLLHLADVNIKAKQHGQTALMLAVSHGRLDMVKMLLEAGADINIQDDDGSTALMCAAEHGHIEIVKYFLSHPDCDSNITDVDGSTALKIAMEAGHRHIGVLLYAHDRSLQMGHGHITKKAKIGSLKTSLSSLIDDN